jgi:hypothetical protein
MHVALSEWLLKVKLICVLLQQSGGDVMVFLVVRRDHGDLDKAAPC